MFGLLLFFFHRVFCIFGALGMLGNPQILALASEELAMRMWRRFGRGRGPATLFYAADIQFRPSAPNLHLYFLQTTREGFVRLKPNFWFACCPDILGSDAAIFDILNMARQSNISVTLLKQASFQCTLCYVAMCVQ